ncbi:MAG: glycoside hydrolase [Planctomycetaceae bacterium]|nr:glycoside hydrolase [Planctomycetaceae bacterium]
MKKRIFLTMIVLFCVSLISLPVAAQDWILKQGNAWSRQAGAIKQSTEKPDNSNGKETIRIEHTGDEDWALSEGNRISVKPGEVFELAANLKSEGTDSEKNGNVSISVVLRKKDNEVVQWIYGAKGIYGNNSWTTLRTKFMIPPDIETIEPRIVGYGCTTVWIDNFSATKIESRNILVKDAKPVKHDNRFLSVEIDPSTGTFSVTDKRTNRVWFPSSVAVKNFVVLPKQNHAESDLQNTNLQNTKFTLLNTETLTEYEVSVTLESDLPEIVLCLNGQGLMADHLHYPPAFTSKSGDRLIVPVNEGIGYPVEEKDIRVGRLIAYGGHGICMAFWGHIDDATGAGMTTIIETPDDAAINIARNSVGNTKNNEENLLQINAVWEPSFKEFRYQRILRFVFFDKGGHVAVCKRYRDYAKKIGLFKPFTEKVKTNPNIDLLLGAVNVWYWDKDKVKLVQEMKELGFDRILWSGGGKAEELVELNKIEHVLTSRYDIYQDIMDPAQFDKVWVHGDWTTEAWPHDINWTDPNGNWRKGWAVDQKDKTQPRISCAVICDAKAVPYARKRISEELKTKPFKARFIDTTVAAPWFECYHPDHPMTRSDSRRYKMELLKLIGELGLVCGSETGHDASVPFCDFYEGMLSLGPYRIHESGRDMIRLVEEVPPQIEHFQVNPALRLPLWELVYHDCVVAQWYWGDYNNKLPKVWRKRDLLNALYGTPPMYMFTQSNWNENKLRFAESYKTAAGTARETAYAEMTDHRILSPNRLVQQSVFSNGVTVTVNFSDQPFQLPDGSTLNGNDWKLQK